MTEEQILQDHLATISLAIGKADLTVMSTAKIPADELTKHRKRREDLQETSQYIKYLLFSLKQQQEKESGAIITPPESKIITMQ